LLPYRVNKHSIDYRVKNFKKVIRFFHIFLFAFMLSVCMIMGIAPVIPKRKQQFRIEIKIEETEKRESDISKTALFKADS
jgi:hypothetical protein